MLPDRVFQVAVARIDLASLPLSCRQRFNLIQEFEIVAVGLPDHVSAVKSHMPSRSLAALGDNRYDPTSTDMLIMNAFQEAIAIKNLRFT